MADIGALASQAELGAAFMGGQLTVKALSPYFGPSASKALERIKRLKDLVNSRDSSRKQVDKKLEEPETFDAICQAILAAGKTENQDSQEIIADLIVAILDNENPNSIFSLAAAECCLILPKLRKEHLRYLAIYTIFTAIIPNQHFSEPNGELPQTTALVESLASPLLREIDDINLSDLRFMDNIVDCLDNIGPTVRDAFGKSINDGKFLGVNIPNFANPRPSFWTQHSNIFTRNSFLESYRPTMKGELIGYFVLQYLSNYQGPFYGFE